MRAILVDLLDNANGLHIRYSYLDITARIANKTLLDIQLEYLKNAGIEKITVLTKNDIPKEFKDGNHWNVDLNFSDSLPSAGIEDDEKDVFLLPANILLDLDTKRFLDDYHRSRSSFSTAVSSSAEVPLLDGFFYPTLIDIAVINDIIREQQGLDPQQASKIMGSRADLINRPTYRYDIHFLDTHLKYWNVHKHFSQNDFTSITYPGFPLKDNVWIDVDSVLDPHTDIDGLLLIGKNSKIHRDVKIKGFVVIGDNVVIDKRAKIENSVIMDNTYAGTDIHIKDSIVNKNFLFQAEKNMGMVIEENFIISETGWKNHFLRGFGKRKLHV